jgi:hypothetical protein
VKIPRPRDPLAAALARLTRAIDPATGQPRRYQSLDALKAACRLEDVVATYLEQEPEDPDANRLKFYCFEHEADGTGGGHTPSLYVNVEQQRWGCEAGCFDGRSGDVVDFLRKFNRGLDQKGALEVLRVWAMYHSAGKRHIRVRLRRKK